MEPKVEKASGLEPKAGTITIPTKKLIERLSKTLSPNKIHNMKKVRQEFRVRKLTRHQKVQLIRGIVDDDNLLVSVVRSYNVDKLTAELAADSIASKLGTVNIDK